MRLGQGVVRLAVFRVRALIPCPRWAHSQQLDRGLRGEGCGPSLWPGFQALLKKACVLGKGVARSARLT